jgi:hypothetical protein
MYCSTSGRSSRDGYVEHHKKIRHKKIQFLDMTGARGYGKVFTLPIQLEAVCRELKWGAICT